MLLFQVKVFLVFRSKMEEVYLHKFMKSFNISKMILSEGHKERVQKCKSEGFLARLL